VDDRERDQIATAIRRLEFRLTRIERELGIGPPPVERPPTPIPATAPPPPIASIEQPIPAIHLRQQEPVPLAPITQPSPPTFEQSSDTPSLESTIGKNWASWIGAVLLVLGMSFFLKYAWEQGWIHPTPAARIAASVFIGIVIAIAAEFVYRKQMRQLAGALYGASIAILIATFFASYSYFGPDQRVLELTPAFAGVAVSALLGILIALHIDVMTPAVIALLGAYLAPAILNSHEDRSAGLFVYLAILAVTGWLLSYFKPRWRLVRWQSFLSTALWYFAWWTGVGDQHTHDALAISFATLFYLGYLVEMFLSSQRLSDIPAATSTGSNLIDNTLDAHLAFLSLLNTACVFGALYALFETQSIALGSIAIGLAVIQGLILLVTRSKSFWLSSALQSISLVTVAAPLFLNDFSITIAWLIMAAAITILGRITRLPGLRWWGVALVLLAAGRVFLFDWWNPALQSWPGALGPVTISTANTRWSFDQRMALAWCTAILAHVVAWLCVQPSPQPAAEPPDPPAEFQSRNILQYARPTKWLATSDSTVLGTTVAAFGTLFFLIACLTRFQGNELTLLVILWTLVIICLSPLPGSPGYRPHAILLLALLSFKWLLFDGITPLALHWSTPSGYDYFPILHTISLNGLLLAGAIVGLYFQLPASVKQLDKPLWFTWAGLVLFFWLNFEALRIVDYLTLSGTTLIADPAIIKQVILSVLWALTGFALVVVGFSKKIAPMRYAALGLLGITLAKILIIDMAQVQAIWRILSFLTVGILLLAVSYLYHKQTTAQRVQA